MLEPVIAKNDKRAYWIIGVFSFVIFAAIVVLGQVKIQADLGFNVHVFAAINAVINSCVAVILIAALVAVKRKNYQLHKRLMIAALVLSVIFLLSYIAHHILAADTKFGGVGPIRYVYFFILITHIILAAVILPFILLTAYRGLTADWNKHKKLARYTWPLWLYIAISGPLVYIMISPYYN